MLNIIRDEVNSLAPHFFDLVVIDESHRSIYNTYGEVLEYFHAIKLGLPDPGEWAARGVPAEFVNSSDRFLVRRRPAPVIFPGFRGEDELHSESFSLRALPLPWARRSMALIKRRALVGLRSRCAVSSSC